MRSDAISSMSSKKGLLEVVKEAFRTHNQALKRNNIDLLAESPLADSPLVQLCLLQNESVTDEVLGRGVQALLHWAVDKLAPGGPHSFEATTWRSYNSLFYPYLHPEGMIFDTLAENMALSTSAVYNERDQALEVITRRLLSEQENPQSLPERKRYFLNVRYQSFGKDDQKILRFIAVFRRPVLIHTLQQLTKDIGIDDPSEQIRKLASGLLWRLNDTLQAHPEARNFLLTYLSIEERSHFHQIAAEFYNQNPDERDYLEAVYHWREAGLYEAAAEALIENYQHIVAQGQLSLLQTHLAEFHPHGLQEKTWARLKIVTGDVAMLAEDVETALAEYGQALATDHTFYKAQAYHRRARAFESRAMIDEALLHYRYAADLLKDAREHHAFLVDIHIDKAWVHLQERPDLPQAEAELITAQSYMPPADSRRRALLNNARAFLSRQLQDLESLLTYSLEAWMAATEAQDKELAVMTGHNLGQVYVWSEQAEKGLEYLQKTLILAEEIGDQQHIAKCHRLIGVYHFFKEDYGAAIERYLRAYAIFQETGNENWLGEIYHDLAEAYVLHKNVERGRHYYNEAQIIAKQSHALRLGEDLAELAKKYPILVMELEPHLQATLEYVQKHGEINSRTCAELTNVQPKAAGTYLTKLADMGLLNRKGRGPSTHYVLK